MMPTLKQLFRDAGAGVRIPARAIRKAARKEREGRQRMVDLQKLADNIRRLREEIDKPEHGYGGSDPVIRTNIRLMALHLEELTKAVKEHLEKQ